MTSSLTINTFKHNGETAKIFHDLEQVMEDDTITVLYAPVGTKVEEVRKGTAWTMDHAAYHIFIKGEHYNFMIVEKDDGNEYYCNLASPPVCEDGQVTYVDYDIDVVLSPEGDITVHDLDQFAERVIAWHYPQDLVKTLQKTQRTIEQALSTRDGYFSSGFYRYLAALLICL